MNMSNKERFALQASLSLLTGLLGLLFTFSVTKQFEHLSRVVEALAIVVSLFFTLSAVILWIMGWIRVVKGWVDRAFSDNLILLLMQVAFGPIAAAYLFYNER